MNIDPKNSLFKQFISDNTSGNKNTKTSIEKSLVTTTQQKQLGAELKEEGPKGSYQSKAEKALAKTKNETSKEQEELKKNKEKNAEIERDPLKLLKLF